MSSLKLRNGSKVIINLANPRPSEIDLDHAIEWTKRNRRFGNHPRALSIHDHMMLVQALAKRDHAREDVIEFASRHDLHEGVLGVDIPRPVKKEIGSSISRLEQKIDRCISQILGKPIPNAEVYEQVSFYDKIACSIEQVLLGHDPDGYIPDWGWEVLEETFGIKKPEMTDSQ